MVEAKEAEAVAVEAEAEAVEAEANPTILINEFWERLKPRLFSGMDIFF